MHYGIYSDGGMKVRTMPKISMSWGGGGRYIHYGIYNDGGMKVRAMARICMSLGGVAGGGGGGREVHALQYIYIGMGRMKAWAMAKMP